MEALHLKCLKCDTQTLHTGISIISPAEHKYECSICGTTKIVEQTIEKPYFVMFQPFESVHVFTEIESKKIIYYASYDEAREKADLLNDNGGFFVGKIIQKKE